MDSLGVEAFNLEENIPDVGYIQVRSAFIA